MYTAAQGLTSEDGPAGHVFIYSYSLEHLGMDHVVHFTTSVISPEWLYKMRTQHHDNSLALPHRDTSNIACPALSYYVTLPDKDKKGETLYFQENLSAASREFKIIV